MDQQDKHASMVIGLGTAKRAIDEPHWLRRKTGTCPAACTYAPFAATFFVLSFDLGIAWMPKRYAGRKKECIRPIAKYDGRQERSNSGIEMWSRQRKGRLFVWLRNWPGAYRLPMDSVAR